MKNPCRSQYHYFQFFFSILLIENRTKSENEREYMYEQKKEGKKDHRRDGLPAEGYEGAGQGHIFP